MPDISLSFIRQWLTHPALVSDLVVSYLKKYEIDADIVEFDTGTPIVIEGQLNNLVYILLEGRVQLTKTAELGNTIHIAELFPGSLVALVSFVTQKPAITQATPVEHCKLIRMTREQFDRFSTHSTEMTRLSQNLIIGNMLDRYDHIMSLHLQMDQLNTQLENDRNQLEETLEQLEKAQNRLISQEKMALLGELVAGVAHEINNPAAALMRAAEHLSRGLNELAQLPYRPGNAAFFNFGLERIPVDTAEQRKAMSDLETAYPALPRPLLRTLSQLQPEPLAAIQQTLDKNDEPAATEPVLHALAWFETGAQLKNVRMASERISNMVKTLKSYSRQDRGVMEYADLRDGLRDTLHLLGGKLENIDVELHLADIPRMRCNSAEINQVWTNIISNACEAMKGKGKLIVSTATIPGGLQVSVEDYGPGIPPVIKEKIFQTNYTTKHTDADFGLGLGLAISTEIVHKHGGKITIEDPEDHQGARFVISFPI